MGLWLIDADALAGSRFVVSALSETLASLKALERASPSHPGERRWLDAHLPAYRARLAGDPVTALLVRAALGTQVTHWIADFITPTPTGDGDPAFAEEVARVRETPPEVARADLTVSLGGPLPALLHRADLPERTTAILEWVVGGDRAPVLAATPADLRGRHRGPHPATEQRRLGRGVRRDAPRDALAR